MTIPLPLERPNLSSTFFDRDPSVVAQQLLGCAFAKHDGTQWVGGYIVETEAYLNSNDLASHSARGQTPRCASMFGQPGTVYVYSIHNRYCLNFVTQATGVGSAVLIRALEPTWEIGSMQDRRQNEDLRKLTSGPGMLCQSLNIDRTSDGEPLERSCGWFLTPGFTIGQERMAKSPRIGTTRSVDLLLRFFIAGNRFVSGRARDHGRPRVDSFA